MSAWIVRGVRHDNWPCADDCRSPLGECDWPEACGCCCHRAIEETTETGGEDG